MPEPTSAPRQRTVAVDWYVPGTMIGDGRPLNGTTYFNSSTPLVAWDAFERAAAHNEVPVRAAFAEDYWDLPRLRHVIDAERLR